MVGRTSFEQLCTGQTGYSCDESSMARLSKNESYNDLLFKLVTKCETSLLFLPSPTNKVTHFTLDIIPNYTTSAVSSTWQNCEDQGYDGLQVLAFLDNDNMPRNGCNPKYTFAQFVNSVIHSLEAYFMFQKFNPSFALNAMNLWSSPDVNDMNTMRNCVVVLAWKFERESVKDLLSRSPLTQLNSSDSKINDETLLHDGNRRGRAGQEKIETQRRKSMPAAEAGKPVTPSKRGRRSVAPSPAEDEDDEITFKKKPADIIPKAVYLPNMSPEKKVAEKPLPMEVDDVTLGFEKAEPKKAGRKSTAGRKSLIPDWPEDQKADILYFFDNLNPSQTEQSCIALSCKYANMQYDCDLSSKILYQWVQKKGRSVQRSTTNFELPESERKEAILELFGKLNSEVSEASRIAFTCKFVHMQFGVTITSKDLYKWLNDKGKKATKRR